MFFAGQHTDSNIGLKGHLDMPLRIGKTYHSWAESYSVEPYVAEDEIFFAGRDVQLLGYVQGANKSETEGNARSIINLVNSFTELVELTCEWGTFSVKVGTIDTTYLSDQVFKVVINMREPLVTMADDIPASDAAQFGIDSISFKALGGALLRVAGDVRSRPQPKQQFYTAYQKEGYQITTTEAPKLEIEMYIEGVNYADFKAKINGLQALLKSPGTRLISVPDNSLREFFVTDGFTVSNLFSAQNYFFGLVTIKAIELFGLEERIGYLTNNAGDFITDNYNNKIKGYGGY